MQWLWSYATSNLSLIALFVAAIAALGLFAFFARSWKALIAAIVLLGTGFAIQQIDKNAFQRAEAEHTAARLADMQSKFNAANKANEADAERAIADAPENAKNEALVHSTPANTGACLDAAAAGRVRAVR